MLDNLSQIFQKCLNTSKRIQTHPNLFERIRIGPGRSQQVRRPPKNCWFFARNLKSKLWNAFLYGVVEQKNIRWKYFDKDILSPNIQDNKGSGQPQGQEHASCQRPGRSSHMIPELIGWCDDHPMFLDDHPKNLDPLGWLSQPVLTSMKAMFFVGCLYGGAYPPPSPPKKAQMANCVTFMPVIKARHDHPKGSRLLGSSSQKLWGDHHIVLSLTSDMKTSWAKRSG